MAGAKRYSVLHYVGYDDDAGGIVSVIRGLAMAGRFGCELGVNRGFVARRKPALEVKEFLPMEGERIGLGPLWQARAIARDVRRWLRADEARVFHGHSRAGLLVGLWLAWWGERRVVVSVHCYGRQRWFYRWAARRLGGRLFWLSPAMRRYYGAAGTGEAGCIPGGVVRQAAADVRERGRGGELRLGGIGALVRWKRWDMVVRALAELPDEVARGVMFDHIGAALAEGESQRYAEELRVLTGSGKIGARVRWRGQVEGSAEFLQEIDVLVVASENEPFSIAMLEALASGVPVLAADSGGAVDVIRPGVNGWLFRTGDAADLARAIGQLVRTRATEAIDREAVRGSAIYADDVAERWVTVYDSLERRG